MVSAQLKLGIMLGGNDLTAVMAASAGGHAGLVEELVRRGANADATDRAGRTALIWAARLGMAEAAGTLVRLEAKLDAKDESGISALAIACAMDCEPLVHALLGAGAKPDIADQYGMTPLVVASSRRSLPAVTALIGAGADVNAKTRRGGLTPVLVAASGDELVCDMMRDAATSAAIPLYGMSGPGLGGDDDRVAVLEALLRAGADPAARDKAGATAADHVRRLTAGPGNDAATRLESLIAMLDA